MSCAASGLRGGVTASLLRVWISETRGRVLLAGWIVTFVGITGRAVYLRRRLNQPRSPKLPDPVVETSEKALEAKKAKTPGPLRSVMRLALPSYRSKTTAWFAIFSLGLGVRLAVSVKVSFSCTTTDLPQHTTLSLPMAMISTPTGPMRSRQHNFAERNSPGPSVDLF